MSIPLSNEPLRKHGPVPTADQIYLARELVDRHDLNVLTSFYDVPENINAIIHTLAYHPDAVEPERTGLGIEDYLRKLYVTSDDVMWITRKLNDFVGDPKYEFKKSHTVFLIDLFNDSDRPLEAEQITDPENEQFMREERRLEDASFF